MIPETYSKDGLYTDYIDYLLDYDACRFAQIPFVPFWVETFLHSLDLIGPETDADLERITARMLHLPTREHLREIAPSLRYEIASVRGEFYFQDKTPLGRKYGVLLHLLDGLLPAPFCDAEWMASIGYAIGTMQLDPGLYAILEQRVKEGLSKYEAGYR